MLPEPSPLSTNCAFAAPTGFVSDFDPPVVAPSSLCLSPDAVDRQTGAWYGQCAAEPRYRYRSSRNLNRLTVKLTSDYRQKTVLVHTRLSDLWQIRLRSRGRWG